MNVSQSIFRFKRSEKCSVGYEANVGVNCILTQHILNIIVMLYPGMWLTNTHTNTRTHVEKVK